MSIGIAATLNDGVVLAADSRDSWFDGERKRDHDNLDKLRPVGDSLFAIPLGLTVPALDAIDRLNKALRRIRTGEGRAQDACGPEQVAFHLRDCVQRAWKDYLPALRPGVNVEYLASAVVVIVGGTANGIPFIARSGVSVECPGSDELSTETSRSIVCGGENQGAQIFEQRAVETLKGVPWNPDKGPMNEWVEGVLQAAVETIQAVISQTDFTGGVIRYAVIRRGFPVLKDIWNEHANKTT